MKETMLYIGILLLILYITYLYFHWRCLRQYAKVTLSEPNPNNVICLVVKNNKKGNRGLK